MIYLTRTILGAADTQPRRRWFSRGSVVFTGRAWYLSSTVSWSWGAHWWASKSFGLWWFTSIELWDMLIRVVGPNLNDILSGIDLFSGVVAGALAIGTELLGQNPIRSLVFPNNPWRMTLIHRTTISVFWHEMIPMSLMNDGEASKCWAVGRDSSRHWAYDWPTWFSRTILWDWGDEWHTQIEEQ